MNDCYRPTIAYSPDALPADQIIAMWSKQFHFLPEQSCEPDKVADFIQRQIWRQYHNHPSEVPVCSRHQLQMVLLGEVGRIQVKIARRLKIDEATAMAHEGIWVGRGLYRCPAAGCYFVASVEREGACGNVR
jgi:hypothetical protein